MKKITTCITFILVMASTINIYAQNASRLTGLSRWEWDNGTWEMDDSVNYHYSPGIGGGIDEMTSENLPYDSSMQVVVYNGGYLPYRKSIQTQSNNNVLTRLTTQSDLTNFNNYKWDAYTYDGNGNRLSDTLQNWNSGTNSWTNQVRRTRTYDLNNNLTSLVLENWNSTLNQWENTNASYYTYNGNQQTDEKMLNWNNVLNQWDSSGWRHFDYNTNNKMDTNLYYAYNSGWIPSQRIYFLYDVNNNNTDQWSAVWNGLQNDWVLNHHWNILYNMDNLAVSDTAAEWDDINSYWYQTTQNDYWYDNNGNRIRHIYRNNDTASDVLTNYFLDSLFYNNYDQITRSVVLYWNTGTNDWGQTNNDKDAHFFYEEYTASVEKVNNILGSMSLYPSPASNVLNIKASLEQAEEIVIAVYDMQGRPVIQWSEKAGKQFSTSIPVSQMSAGTYSVQLRSKRGAIQQKFNKL